MFLNRKRKKKATSNLKYIRKAMSDMTSIQADGGHKHISNKGRIHCGIKQKRPSTKVHETFFLIGFEVLFHQQGTKLWILFLKGQPLRERSFSRLLRKLFPCFFFYTYTIIHENAVFKYTPVLIIIL